MFDKLLPDIVNLDLSSMAIIYLINMTELKKINPRRVDKRHKEEFVSWFEREVSHP
jgi:hypothetical protein